MRQVAEEYVEIQKGSHIAQVHIAIHRRATDVHAHVRRIIGNKGFLLSGKRIEQY